MTAKPSEIHQPASPLPMSREEMDLLGWDALDVLLVTGDAYVDHPSFGVALLGRWLVSRGYRVGIVAQPRWDTTDDVARMGRPLLFAGVTAGALDSMLAHYTAFRKKRHDDAYTPGGLHGARPNRATIVYTSLVRQAFPGLPVVLGGIEASLRRATHYDFWTDRLRKPILLDSKADLVIYGMGERAILETADRLKRDSGGSLHGIPGTVSAPKRTRSPEAAAGDSLPPTGAGVIELPSHEDIEADPKKLMEATLALERHVHDGGKWAVQYVGDRKVVFAPPSKPLESEELDALYDLPYTRRPHPSYDKPIPAADMIQFSVTSHRGCGGGCSFCSLALHQGRRIRSRSRQSIRREIEELTRHPDWNGTVTDVGGPSANMWGAYCAKAVPGERLQCGRTSCLTPKVCPHFKANQAELGRMLQELAAVPGVKSLRVASGIRHDLALGDEAYARVLIGEFVGGQLKLAPEHCRAEVLGLMRKSSFESFERFLTVFERESRRAGKEQYVVPYLMSAFPGCRDSDMRALAQWLKSKGWKPRQVQCFIPTPGTVATAMYYAGIDPDGNPVHVARTDAQRLRQHSIIMPPDDRAPDEKPRQNNRRPFKPGRRGSADNSRGRPGR